MEEVSIMPAPIIHSPDRLKIVIPHIQLLIKSTQFNELRATVESMGISEDLELVYALLLDISSGQVSNILHTICAHLVAIIEIITRRICDLEMRLSNHREQYFWYWRRPFTEDLVAQLHHDQYILHVRTQRLLALFSNSKPIMGEYRRASLRMADAR